MADDENVEHGLEEGVEYVYSIPMPKLPDDLQPLECIVLIQGILMSTGQPTITALGSEGMTPWLGIGLLEIEAARLKMGYTLSAVALDNDEDDDDE